MRTLFLNPPSFLGFDGGAGSRYQAKREIRSFWYPTWLAQAAALVDESRVVDAPADNLGINEVLKISKDFDLVVIYTSTPSFASDSRTAVRIKAQQPDCLIGFVGPHVSVLPEESLRSASAVDFVVRREFEYPIQKIAQGQNLSEVNGVSWRSGKEIIHNTDADLVADLDKLPFVVDVYKRDLCIENYYIGYLKHPYVSIYSGRGCPARCTYCLWPQTISGNTYRVRSVESVSQEMALAKDYFPQTKEFFIDDDTFTANPQRAQDIARILYKLGITWSTTTRANISYDTLKVLKESGLRLLMVGYESGSDQILRNVRKGVTTDMARQFTKDCKSLGIELHGTFMLGLPGETKETIEQTIRYANELDPETMQVSIAAPYPGTELYRQAQDNGWLAPTGLVSSDGTQSCPLQYDNLTSKDILSSVDRFYKSFYFRPKVMARIGKQMLQDSEERRRRLREGKEFLNFLNRKENNSPHSDKSLKRILRDGGPGFAQFAITDACNARCKFCNFNIDMPDSNKRIFVKTDQACAAIDILAENGIEYIAFVGGEPTMHSCLPDMLGHAKLLGINTMVCTNGALLTRDRINLYVAAGVNSMIISIDAPNVNDHEHNRGLPGVCDRIKEANILFHSHGVSTTASVTINRLLGNLSELPDFLKSLNFDQVTFSYPLHTLPSTFRSYSDSELIEYTNDELYTQFEEIKKLKKRFRVLNPTASLSEMQRFIRGERQQFPCLAGHKYFHLDWNLDLYRCHAWHEPICSIFEYDSSLSVRDGCTKCMVDCYRDASVLHCVGMSIYDAGQDISQGRFGKALTRLVNRPTYESAKSVLEDIRWVRKL